MQQATITDLLAVAEEVIKAISIPMGYLLPLIQAVTNGALFFGAGMNAPHYHYEIDGAVNFLRQVAAKVA